MAEKQVHRLQSHHLVAPSNELRDKDGMPIRCLMKGGLGAQPETRDVAQPHNWRNDLRRLIRE